MLRLFSNYFHRLKCCLGDITFEQWTEQQILTAETCLAQRPGEQLWPSCGEEGLFAGFYGMQLERWVQHFCPSQFSLVSFTGFIADPAYIISRIMARVGIHHVKGVPKGAKFKSHSPMEVTFESLVFIHTLLP